MHFLYKHEISFSFVAIKFVELILEAILSNFYDLVK